MLPSGVRHKFLIVTRSRKSLLAVAVATLLGAAACASPIHVSSSSTARPSTAATARPATGSTNGDINGSGALSQFQSTLHEVATKAGGSVVEISNSSGVGSGIVLDTDGDIVTNAHVVEGAGGLTVTTGDGKRYNANVVGTYGAGDLAVVRAQNASGLTPASFADSSKVQVGDVVLAIGAPYGLNGTVTEGIVSAVGREISEGGGVTLTDLIQTTAAINPGNSGGALVDIQGRVIGIPTIGQTPRRAQGEQAPENIGFAIPSNQVTAVARQLVATGSVTHTGRAYLAVTVSAGDNGGALIKSVVSGGPADKAGITAGAVIRSIGGHAVSDPDRLSQVLSGYKPGDKVSVSIDLPDGSSKTVTVTLGERPTS
jgi:S1-C subfamily serine protease